jgi:uncharacterized protein YabN with tetrapyrrole methylase and pyrophosphatase domain
MNRTPDIYVVGSGVQPADHLTVEALSTLGTCSAIFTFIPTPFIELLPYGIAAKTTSLQSLYRDGIRRSDIYQQAVDVIWQSCDRSRPVAYLAVGNPVVFDSVTAGLLARGRDGSGRVHVVPGISSVDAVIAAIGTDYAPGLQVFDATSMVAHNIAPRVDIACVLLQPGLFGTPFVTLQPQTADQPLRPLRDHLLHTYPAAHQVTFVTCGGASAADTRINRFALAELADLARFPPVPGASLYIPPIRTLPIA